MNIIKGLSIALLGAVGLGGAPGALADDKEMIDANTARAISWLKASGKDTEALLDRAAGVLVFPDIVKMGFGVGGEFGEGSLVVKGETVDYYVTAGTTYGMSPESEYKAEVIFFMTEEALQEFRRTHSWKVGDHAHVPVAVSSTDELWSSHPHVGMVFSEDGLVSHLQLKGDRITRIAR
ncbi:lipid-binding SYLF domain-containing protein [Gymnodinialimonas sp.]